MIPALSDRSNLARRLRSQQAQGKLAAFSLADSTLRLRTVGPGIELKHNLEQEFPGISVDDPIEQKQPFHFLSRELRPGSGIVRAVDGTPSGPGGTLTCLLSSRDGRDIYFAAAAHVLTNYWKGETPPVKSSVYLNERGFPSRESVRFLGEVDVKNNVSAHPDLADPNIPPSSGVTIDIGIVKLEGDFAWRQRTTCYGSFGELSDDAVKQRWEVRKCGAEEPHGTPAPNGEITKIVDSDYSVAVYGRDPSPYSFQHQVIISGAGFAVPGDSGTMVVESGSRRPIGMLIAGSVLDGLYVMTPISALRQFWEDRDLVFL